MFTYLPENCQLTSSFFVGARTVVRLLQTTQIKQGVSFIAANKVYTSTNKTTIVSVNRDGTLFFFLPAVDASHVYVRAQDPNLSEGADRIGGQLRRDKECPFSGVTKSGRVCRKVPESDVRSVGTDQTPSTGLRHPSFNNCRI